MIYYMIIQYCYTLVLQTVHTNIYIYIYIYICIIMYYWLQNKYARCTNSLRRRCHCLLRLLSESDTRGTAFHPGE